MITWFGVFQNCQINTNKQTIPSDPKSDIISINVFLKRKVGVRDHEMLTSIVVDSSFVSFRDYLVAPNLQYFTLNQFLGTQTLPSVIGPDHALNCAFGVEDSEPCAIIIFAGTWTGLV